MQGGDDDTITATTLPAGVIKLTLDGGAGNDTLLGSQGADMILGGDGNDFVFGDNGNDMAQMGAGDDVFQWDPGTATTPSTAKTVPTRCRSLAPTSPKSSNGRDRRTADCSVTSPT